MEFTCKFQPYESRYKSGIENNSEILVISITKRGSIIFFSKKMELGPFRTGGPSIFLYGVAVVNGHVSVATHWHRSYLPKTVGCGSIPPLSGGSDYCWVLVDRRSVYIRLLKETKEPCLWPHRQNGHGQAIRLLCGDQRTDSPLSWRSSHQVKGALHVKEELQFDFHFVCQ